MSAIIPNQPAAKLAAGTVQVSPDEPCFGLVEVDLIATDGHGFRRYQILTVVRAGRLSECWTDLGPRERYKCGQFRIPGGARRKDGKIEIWHRVGELQDIADSLRAQSAWCPDPLPLRDTLEQQIHEAAAHTVIGPHFKKQRS